MKESLATSPTPFANEQTGGESSFSVGEVGIFSVTKQSKVKTFELNSQVKLSFYSKAYGKASFGLLKKLKIFTLKCELLNFAVSVKNRVFKRRCFEACGEVEAKNANFIIDNTGNFYHPYSKNPASKYICVIHINYDAKVQTAGKSFLAGLKDYDAVVILSSVERERWLQHHDFVCVIPNFLPQIPSLSTTYSQKAVLSVGRMDEGDQKGFFRLLDIWKIVQDKLANSREKEPNTQSPCGSILDEKSDLRGGERGDKTTGLSTKQASKLADLSPKDNAQWKLIIVGDGVLKKELESKIKALNLQESVILKPFTKQIEKEYLSASIYAMTSHFEGFGMVLAEASSYALPCVAFDVKTGPSDIIADEKSGFLVADNDLQGYADKLMLLMRDENLRQNFGTKAKRVVSEKFGKNAVMKMWFELFEELTQKA